MRRILKKHRYIVLFLLTASAFGLWRNTALSDSPNLRVQFLDVGQGDATFFETPAGTQVLIDGGPKQNILKPLADAMPFWDRTIDLVIATHPQLDHISGLVPVLERYTVKRIMLNAAVYKLDAYAALLELVERKHIPLTLARAGEVLRFDNGITGYMFNPIEDIVGKILPYDINETSIVMRLDYGQTSFLFTGDAGFYTEDALMEREASLDVDVLKIGHHGSKHATSEKFLRATTPHIAVIEVGAKNTYGHPTFELLQRLAIAGVTVFRTDRDGTVTLESDGRTVSRITRQNNCWFFCSVTSQTLFIK